LTLQSTSYKSVHSILKNGLERAPLPGESEAADTAPIAHPNIRGADYYN
jgi:hypothetical protein